MLPSPMLGSRGAPAVICSVVGAIVLGWLKVKLEKEIEMSNLWPLEFFLGVAFKRNRIALTITMS